MPDPSQAQSAAYLLGRDALGQTFVSFAHLLLRHANRQRCHRLAFVSRDGDLLMRVVAQLPPLADKTERPELTYLHLSRRATSLPARPMIDATAFSEALSARAGAGSIRETLEYLGIPPSASDASLARLGIDPELSSTIKGAVALLLKDREFHIAVLGERRRQRDTLAAYLAQERVGYDLSTMLVDIGWRGSILRNLTDTFCATPHFQVPSGAFFGLWADQGYLPSLPGTVVGLISDMRRRRNVVEGSAWYAAFLLEAICRANEGTTLGYASRNGRIEPILAGDCTSRRSEIAGAGIADAIRRGVLDYVMEYGGSPRWHRASDSELRTTAQHALLRLACFPTVDQIAVGAHLVHTEAHATNWCAPLIAVDHINPVISPRRWLAGLASPWRMAYVKINGGALFTWGLLLAESILLRLPPGYRRTLTGVARALAGIGGPR